MAADASIVESYKITMYEEYGLNNPVLDGFIPCSIMREKRSKDEENKLTELNKEYITTKIEEIKSKLYDCFFNLSGNSANRIVVEIIGDDIIMKKILTPFVCYGYNTKSISTQDYEISW